MTGLQRISIRIAVSAILIVEVVLGSNTHLGKEGFKSNGKTKPFHFDIPYDPDHPELSKALPTPDEFYSKRTSTKRTRGPDNWRKMAQDSLKESLARQNLNTNVAKNVIIFIGDGLGIPTTTAARIFEGYEMGMDGEEHLLSFEKFPYSALSKVYNADWQVPDSAGSASAILCGIKSPVSTVGVDDGARQYYCPSQPGHEVKSITYWAQDAGKATGVVTNTAITHATPAAAYANSVGRGYESDQYIPPMWTEMCPDIARQLIEKGHKINVAFGGGRANFLGRNHSDPIATTSNGNRRDNRHLINEWIADKENKGASHQVVYTRDELLAVDPSSTDYLFGLFSRSGHMSYEVSRGADQPSLEEMTGAAIDVLKNDPNGFFLMVEGGRIDLALHGNRAHSALIETRMFAKAIQTAVDKTSEEDTLIIVTADHSHTLSLAGYHLKGTSPLGKGIYNGEDLLPYTKLMFATGPGYSHDENGRGNLFGFDPRVDPNYRQQSAVPLGSGTHGGDDVAIYARGPMAHLFQGVKEQHYIAHAAGYAACIGDNQDHCGSRMSQEEESGSSSPMISGFLLAASILLALCK